MARFCDARRTSENTDVDLDGAIVILLRHQITDREEYRDADLQRPY
jgi:hypothetical protein